MSSLYLLGSSNYTKNMYAHFTRNTIIFSLKNISPFLVGSHPPRLILNWHSPYLEDVSNIPSTRWYKLWYTIDQPPFQARQPSFLSTSELEIKRRSRPSKDEIAKFLTKTERKTCKNTKQISHDRCYLPFEQHLQGITSVYIPKQCPQIGQSFEESLRGGMIRYTLLEWIINNYWI